MRIRVPVAFLVCAMCVATTLAWAGVDEKDLKIPSPPKPGWQPAPTNQDGNVIAARLLYNGKGEGHRVGEEVEAIPEQYGIAVVYREEHPKAFYVFDNVAKTYFATRDFEAFLKQVTALSEGRSFAWIDTCTRPSYADLPAAQLERLKRALKRKKIDPEDATDGHHTCYCTATSIRWPDVPGSKGPEPCEWVFRP